jgi:hypothetical protein
MKSAHVSASYPITINTGLAITSVAPPSGAINIAYGPSGTGFCVAASGGIPPYAVSWSPAGSSETPPGLSLTNEKILGTPTTEGAYDVIVSVTDSESPAKTIDAPYTINIGSVAITSDNPPIGKVGLPYRDCNPSCLNGGYPLAADGGTPPYSFGWVAALGSSTPPGLHIGGLGSPSCLSPCS